MHQNKDLNAAASIAKGRVPWHNAGPNPKINCMVMIDWLTTGDNYNRWCSGDKQNELSHMIKIKVHN